MAYTPPPGGPWYQNYWGYYNRPWSGCGCLYTLLVILLIWALIALIYPPAAVWAWF